MKKINDLSAVKSWGYHDARLGKGFTGTYEHIAMQVQEAYIRAGIPFRDHEIGALIQNFMCEQGLASPCSELTTGLGDVLHKFLQPAAELIDRYAGTKLGECPSCKGRKDTLNHMVPL